MMSFSLADLECPPNDKRDTVVVHDPHMNGSNLKRGTEQPTTLVEG
jgi:hypothetical protein